METQYIRVPSEKERAKMADDAITRHNNSAPIEYNSRGIYKCCGVIPEYRKGGAVISSFECPKCKRNNGIWSLGWTSAFNNWNSNIYTAMWHREGDKHPLVNKNDFVINIDGYNEGWRYINNIDFRICHKSFKYESYDRYYSDYKDTFDLYSAIVKYNVDTNEFEFWHNNKIHKLEYNPPKSGGNVAYGYNGNCIIDNDKEHKYAKHHDRISFSGYNYKWSSKLFDFVEELRKE